MGTRGMRTVLRLLGVGWFVALTISGFGLGGYLLDQRFDIGPVLTLIGLALGVSIALVGMYRMLMAVVSSTSRPEDEGQA